MSKKILLFITALLITSFSISPLANAASENQIIEHLPDGSYLVTVITNGPARKGVNTVTKTKTTTYYSNDNIKLWSYSITATFQYGNGASTCTNVFDNVSIMDNAWSCAEHSTSKAANNAYGYVTMIEKFLGIKIGTIERSLTLTCSSTGIVS